MKKSRARLDRATLVDALADHLLDHGLGRASLRDMARAAGTSDRMLLYYFADKGALLTEVLGHIAGRLAAALDREIPAQPKMAPAVLLERLERLIEEGLLTRPLRIWVEVLTAAAAGDEACAALGNTIGRQFHAWAASRLDLPPDEADAVAALVLAAVDGAVMLQPVEGGALSHAALTALADMLRRRG